MSTRITADNGIEITVGLLAIEVTDPEYTPGIYARLTDAQRVELAAALDPGRRGLHVRLDNQAATLATYQRELDEAVARAEQLEREVSKIEGRASEWSIKAQQWQDRAERAERERDEALRKKGEAFDRAVRAERERDAAVARAEQAEMERERADCEREEIADQFATFRAEIVAEAVKARESAITRADIENQLRIAYESGNHPIERIRVATDAMCDLFGVEAEQAVDPVDEQTDALADILYGDELVTDQMRGVLERVVRAGMLFPEQEADQ